VDGIKVMFSTSIGTIESPETTTNGIATTTITSSTSPGTAVVEASAILDGANISNTVHVACIKTTETECNETMENITVTAEEADNETSITVANTGVTIEDGFITINTTLENSTRIAENATANSTIYLAIKDGILEITMKNNATANNSTVNGDISKIKLNTSTKSYITSKTDIGVITTDLDVEFKGNFTPSNLGLTLTLIEHYDRLKEFIFANGSEIKENITAAFGIEGITSSEIEKNTAILVYSQLSGTYIKNNVTGVPISITVNRDWFNNTAKGDSNKVSMFKINGTTGKVENKTTPASVTICNDTVTFSVTFDHFSVFALIAQPPHTSFHGHSEDGEGSGAFPFPTPSPEDITPLLISNVSVILGHSALISWDTNEISNSLVKYGMKPRQYTIEKYDSDYTLFHSIHLKELKGNGTYYFAVNSTDQSSNSAETPEYIFVLISSSKEKTITKIFFPSMPYFIISWWIVLVAIVAALVTSFIVYKRHRHNGK